MGISFGVDIGIASVGWAVVDEEYNVLEAGANLFSSAEASENVARRSFRQGKRLLRRRGTRLKEFDKLWVDTNLVLPSSKCNSQLELRVTGLDSELTVEELYFALKNMLTHRGISYMEDALDDSQSGKSDYERGLKLNQKELAAQKMPCEIQYERIKKYGRYRGNIDVLDDAGEAIVLSNVFTVEAYCKEAEKILSSQKEYHPFITDEFVAKYIGLIKRKREYYVGPGNENSRTDYGRYTTKIDKETGKYITEENIFEKLIGKCSVYPDQTRAAGATYTAQEFNVLNDLNNLFINERKLEKDEKIKIIKEIQSAKSVNVKKIIGKVTGENLDNMRGARIDKNEKEIFHSFETYNKMRREFERRELDFELLDKEDLDEIGNILTINTEKNAILSAFEKSNMKLNADVQECLIEFRRKNATLFSKWQSFSLKIMKELIPEMYEQPKNQMELLTCMGVFKKKEELFTNCANIPCDTLIEDIYNPVVRRSIRITIKVINALIKKYGYPNEIVVEMPRDRNSDEEKKRISDMQKNNEKELKGIIEKIQDEYGIKITGEHFRNHKKLALKLKLWNEQDGICLYSGKTIAIPDLLNDPSQFEIDHVIPKSISFDDSRTNKVLVYNTENQKKKNTTPYMYLNDDSRKWSFHEYMSYVLDLKEKKLITRSKVEKLLYREDITKVEVLKGFISRNINDTRYASRVVLNSLQGYFRAKGIDTKVKVIRGSFTHQMRQSLMLDKNREETYAHHAVDAMLISYSQMGYEAYHKMLSEFIDFEENKVTNLELWKEKMGDKKLYDELMYQEKWIAIRGKILAAEKKVKFWHRVDKKANRGLCNQTIRGTRNIEKKIMKINKLDIYSQNGYKTFENMLAKGKEKDFLMYRNDEKTWCDLIKVYEAYKSAKNAFAEYEKETGDYLRKYAKNHKGPRVINLKYLDGEVGSCIDISHKYGYEKNSRKVILESLKPYRSDVYYDQKNEKYYIVGVKYSDCKFSGGKYVIDAETYQRLLVAEGVIFENQSMEDLSKLEIVYQFSLYKNDYIEYEKNGEVFKERFLSRTMPKKLNYIETKPIERSEFEKRHWVGLAKATSIKKIRTDILGNRYYAKNEKFSLEVDKF